jgi:hypothetical protein
MSFKKSWGLGVFAAAMMLVSPALAQDIGQDIDQDIDERDVDIYEYDDGTGGSGFMRDLGVSVRGGLNSYTGELGEDTGPGAFLGVQAESRPWNLVGLELGYEGARNPIENFDGAGLWKHNVGALAKVGPQLGPNDNLRPFVGAGLGVSLLNPSEEAEFIYENDVVTEVPVAAGVDYKLGAVTAGARATYRFLGAQDQGGDQTGNAINFGLNLGGSF